MNIFTINHKPDLQIGMTVYVSRDKQWACLPAIRWDTDAVVENVLPVLDPGLYGWWEVLPTGGIKQILRDSYNESGQYGIDMDSYLLQTDEEFVVGKIQVLGAKSATFEVLRSCRKDTFSLVTGLMDRFLGTKADYISIISVCSSFPTTLRWGNYCVHLESEQGITAKLHELVERLPHGSGWNGTWSIEATGLNMYKIGIEYETYGEAGFSNYANVGWNIYHTDKWHVGESTEPLPEADPNDEIDWEYLIGILGDELEDSLNG